MDADEIRPLTRESVEHLIRSRKESAKPGAQHEKRQRPRWPFPGAVELWLPVRGGGEKHVLAVCQNISEGGIGLRCESRLEEGAMVNIAVHQPEVSLHGKAVVRHCTARDNGYLAGLEFSFGS